MPCDSFVPDRDSVSELRELLENEISNRKGGRSELKKELDRVTAFLCGILRKNPELAKSQKGLPQWWEQHKEWDKNREG